MSNQQLPPLLLDGPALAHHLHLHPQTLRKWAADGLIERRGKDAQGRVLYDYDEVSGFAATRRGACLRTQSEEHGA